MRAPAPAALPTEATCAEVAVRDHAEHHRVLGVDVAAEGAGEAGCGRRCSTPRSSISSATPAYSAAFASWIARTSFCVIFIGTSPRAARKRRCGRRRRSRSLRAASAPSMTPSWLMMPARYISAMTSMMPEPQTPVTPVRGRRRGEARIVRPQVAADHLEARLERRGIDAHALDGAGRRALAAADLRALEGGAGRARAGEQPLAVAEHDLGIGADVDQQRDLVAEVRPLGEDHAGGVGADVAGDAGQHVDARVRDARRYRAPRRGSVSAWSTASANGAPPSSTGSMPSTR